MKCIYCNAETDLTSSDIISYAITGAKLSRSFVCHTHNALTNDKYEKKFIKDMDFFRNHLGLTTRDGKPIQYSADLSIDGQDMHGVTLSGRESLFNPKGVVSGFDKNGKKMLFAPTSKLAPFDQSRISSINPSKITLHKTISSDIFLGFAAVHSIAKIAYEWHCYINNIGEYDPIYQDIVEYIISDQGCELVEVVVDPSVYFILDQLANIGSNTLFEYDDSDGYRYVVFSLWQTVAYRIRICNSPSQSTDNRLSVICIYEYRIDGTRNKSAFGTASFSGQNMLHFQTVECSSITSDQWHVLVDRIEKILKTQILSISSLKRQVTSLQENLAKYRTGKIDVAQLLGYEEENIIGVIETIDCIYENESSYDATKSFNDNLAIILKATNGEIHRTNENTKAFAKSLVDLHNQGNLATYIQERIDSFHRIVAIEESKKI